MAQFGLILGLLACVAVVTGNDLDDFLRNKIEEKPNNNRNLSKKWDIVINREPVVEMLVSSKEEVDEMSLGLPVSEDLVFSKRRRGLGNSLPRNDEDTISTEDEPAEISPTYYEIKGSATGQLIYFAVVVGLCSALASLIALAGYVAFTSFRPKPSSAEQLEEELESDAEEGEDLSQIPGPSNVAIEIDSPSTDSADSDSPVSEYQKVTIMGETQL